jgi:hypothetical protein
MFSGSLQSTGAVQFQRIGTPRTLAAYWRHGTPFGAMPREVRAWRVRNFPQFWAGFWRVALACQVAKLTQCPAMYGVLSLVRTNADGTRTDFGVASLQKVTSAFVAYLATRLFDGNTSIGAFDFHAYGTGTTAESNADTALVTELTTQYATDSTRPTGTPTNPSAGVYQTVATLSPDTGGTLAITEHGIFSASSAGTLMDRSVFAAVNILAGSESITGTYQLVYAAEA